MRRPLIAIALSSVLLTAGFSQVRSTDAAWVQSEWAHSPVGTTTCDTTGEYRTRGNGRLLSGGLLGLDLDTVAAVRGMTVTNNATSATPTPAAATASGANSWRNPLDVGVLSAIELPLSGTFLDDLLELPLNTEVGVLNQWAQANSTGRSAGAAGVVNDSGVVMTAGDFGGGEPPDLGTLKLSRVVSSVTGQAVGDLVAGLADLDLEIGAVAGRAMVDTCAQDWNQAAALTREYAIAGLDLAIDTPLVGNLVTTVNGTLDATETLVAGLAGNAGVLSAITGGISDLLTGPLAALGLGNVTITGPTATVDFAAVEALLSDPIQDANDMLEIDLDGGVVRVDLAKLLGEAYDGTGFAGTGAGLNGLDPNTELVLNDAAVNSLTGALTAALDDWVADVLAAARQAVLAAKVSFGLNLTLKLGALDAVAVNVSASNVALSSLMNGSAGLTVNVTSLLGECGVLNPVACTVNGLLTGLTSALTSGIGPIVGNAVNAVLLGPTSPIATLGATLQSVTAPVVTLVGTVLRDFLGVNGLVSLRANVQNDAGAPTYPEWEPPSSQAVPTGRYDVAALGVVVLGAAGTSTSVNLELARGSVGVNCPAGATGAQGAPCAGY